MNGKTAYPYSVRRQKSGRYTGLHRYIVVRNPGGKRVHECPPSTELAAWCDADRLNVKHWAQERGWEWSKARDLYVERRLNPVRSMALIPHLVARRDVLRLQIDSNYTTTQPEMTES